MAQDTPLARAASQQSLYEVLEQLQEVFVVCDADDVIVFSNQRFRALNAAVEPWTRAGRTYEEFLRAALAQRLFPAGLGREEEYLAAAMAQRRAGDWPIEIEYAGGPWLLVNFSRLSDGGSLTYGTDITARKRAEAELARQSERLLIGQRTAGMIVMDWDVVNDELHWSDDPAWLRGPLPPSGQYPLYKEQVHPEDRDRFLAVRAEGVKSMQRQDQEYRIVRTDGKVLWLRSERVVMPGPDGRAARMLVALHDITGRKETEQAVQRMNEELERRVVERTAELASANRDLESFSYSVSHDLRGPLRAIAGFVNLLREEDGAALSAEGRRHLGVVEDNALRMSALIDALLALAHASRRAVARVPVDMGQLAREVCAELAPAYPAVHFQVGELPPALGDATLLRQVFTNLVDNALKYSSRVATPRVELGAENLDGETAYFVRDNGVGFDMAHAGRLFEMFHRLQPGGGFGGEGIGLALASQIVKRHHGRIWAQAAPGQGATFRFVLGGALETGA
ncbi:MAG TPA: ATP-binding protein [Burkholderiales bacterium]|jgi:signal transduction histidine kinase